MTRLPIPSRGYKRLKPLIELAQAEGWHVERTGGGHLKLTKPGLPPIYTGSTSSDHRATRSALARMRRETRFADECDHDG
ncbi:type II toxin-antitoxin system HicA family toxin [uncultured Porticoccus sp.]|jgi:hypothetical protein|uniref:type II toxin-antitoxin system HicA family toxin n=1 Tax=uncultured Porticoccus sp. TaxID=1256050 RepID=UPI00260E0E6C|nr:type II toxin-antitoxin system HicA family toxin [uncultured Porticoccus sp.]